jgi:hypothetical protein
VAPALQRSAVEKTLVTKLQMQQEVRDHRWFQLEVNGRLITRTYVSTGTKYKTLGNDLVSKMAHELQVPTGFLVKLVNCQKSREEYIQHLQDTGKL